MSEQPELITASPPPDSPARTRPPSRLPFRVGAFQERWHSDREEHQAALAAGMLAASLFFPARPVARPVTA